jgi:hypothetical protein
MDAGPIVFPLCGVSLPDTEAPRPVPSSAEDDDLDVSRSLVPLRVPRQRATQLR